MITLKILKKDMQEGQFFNPRACPITKALIRAGYPSESHHRGVDIVISDGLKKTIFSREIYLSIAELGKRVADNDTLVKLRMEPEDDFEVDLPIPSPEEWKELTKDSYT